MKNLTKNTFHKNNFITLIVIFLLVGLGEISAQSRTYAMQSAGITYKVYIHQGSKVSIQLYDSQSNQWAATTLVETIMPEEDETGGPVHKVRAKNGTIYEMSELFSGSWSLSVRINGRSFTYQLESSKE
ncbi:MAG: hypothetical protein SFU27_13825 [Thermonemataceae bacterium]|nr:hypothetical protein [Thermonemataceae bacterium]